MHSGVNGASDVPLLYIDIFATTPVYYAPPATRSSRHLQVRIDSTDFSIHGTLSQISKSQYRNRADDNPTLCDLIDRFM